MIWYRWLLKLYPDSFRGEYGGEMEAIFAKRLGRARGIGARAGLWLESLVDVARSAPAAHLDLIRQDAGATLRAWRHAPAFALTAILVSALGIGAATVSFAVADHVLIRPLPFPEPERLVKLYQDQTFRGYSRMEVSPGNFVDYRRQSQSYTGMAAYTTWSGNLVGAGEPVRVDGALVTGELFGVLGVPAALGRTLTTLDDRLDTPRVIVLSHGLWTTLFGRAPDVLGQHVLLNDTPHTIVGVMGPDFSFPSREEAYWAPLRFEADDLEDRTNWYLNTVARLRDGATLDSARAEASVIAADLARAYPEANKQNGATLIRLRDQVTARSRMLLWALAGASLCMLLIACTNLASFLLARAIGRQRELAVRAALGASRARLLRQMGTENVLLALVGGLVGAGLAIAAVPLVSQLVPTTLPITDAPAADLRLVGLSVAITVATAMVIGMLPAGRGLAGGRSMEALREGGRVGPSRSTERLRAVLVVAEVTISVVLVVAAGLLIQALWRVQGVHPGFRTEGVLTLRTSLSAPQYAATGTRERFYGQVLDDVRAIPGVEGAAYISFLPMVMRGGIWPVTVDGRAPDSNTTHTASLRLVTPGFFDALNIPLLQGRDVSEKDAQSTPRVAVVSQSFAERHWPGQPAIGRRATMAFAEVEIIGVVGDVKVRGLERESEPQVYFPSGQVPDGSLIGYAPKDLVIRTGGDPASLTPQVRAIVARADAQVPVSDVRTLTAIVESDTAARAVQVRVLGAFAAMAVLLAGVGLHSLLAFSVAARTREIGVRLALGATRGRILGLVVRNGLVLVGVGVVAGGFASVWVGRALQSLLFGVSPASQAAYLGAAALCLLMAVAGTVLPALRASRVDPVEAMRAE